MIWFFYILMELWSQNAKLDCRKFLVFLIKYPIFDIWIYNIVIFISPTAYCPHSPKANAVNMTVAFSTMTWPTYMEQYLHNGTWWTYLWWIRHDTIHYHSHVSSHCRRLKGRTQLQFSNILPENVKNKSIHVSEWSTLADFLVIIF